VTRYVSIRLFLQQSKDDENLPAKLLCVLDPFVILDSVCGLQLISLLVFVVFPGTHPEAINFRRGKRPGYSDPSVPAIIFDHELVRENDGKW
jgi:hypothetical protein